VKMANPRISGTPPSSVELTPIRGR
jgi:hypothetical protein